MANLDFAPNLPDEELEVELTPQEMQDVAEMEGGEFLVDLDGNPAIEVEVETTADLEQFDVNLADGLSDDVLNKLSTKVLRYVDEDEMSRADWRRSYAKGLDLLGLKYEERSQPWAGACGAFHPVMLESVIRFQADAMSELVPPTGPAKIEIVGDLTERKKQQGDRVKRDINYQCMHKIPGYRNDTESLLLNLATAGGVFRKIWFDPVRKVPRVQTILPEFFLLPYASTCLETATRYTHIMELDPDEVRKYQKAGLYRDIELPPSSPTSKEDIQEARDKIQGETPVYLTNDNNHVFFECYCEFNLSEDDPLVEDDLGRPYIVTVDQASRKVMGVRRNWAQDDPTFQAVQYIVAWNYLPGFNCYGLGIVNVLGGLTKAITEILRQLVDAGQLANLPAGFKSKQIRIENDSTPLSPGEWRDATAVAGSLKDGFVPIPYKEPSTTLYNLLTNLVDEARRIGAVADMKVTDLGSQQMPVGTVLAILERTLKIMNAVMKRCHASMGQELSIIARVMRDFMPNEYPFELPIEQRGANRKEDYDARVDIIPVSDPNASTTAMRIMKLQLVFQLAQSSPELYDMPYLHQTMLRTMEVENVDKIIPSGRDVSPRDPVTENMDLINGRPVRAGLEQDHAAHIQVHMAALEDPKIGALMEKNPNTPKILAAGAAHMQEHVAFQYRREIEKSLGFPLPPPDEPLPSDIEYELAGLVARAADKVLGRSKAESERKRILDAMEDPIVQQRERELDLKEADMARKEREARLRIGNDLRKHIDQMVQEDRDRQASIGKTVFDAAVERERAVSAEELEGAKAGIDLVNKTLDRNSKSGKTS